MENENENKNGSTDVHLAVDANNAQEQIQRNRQLNKKQKMMNTWYINDKDNTTYYIYNGGKFCDVTRKKC